MAEVSQLSRRFPSCGDVSGGVQVLSHCSVSTGSMRCEYPFLRYYRLCTSRSAIYRAYGKFLGSIYIMCFAAGKSVMLQLVYLLKIVL